MTKKNLKVCYRKDKSDQLKFSRVCIGHLFTILHVRLRSVVSVIKMHFLVCERVCVVKKCLPFCSIGSQRKVSKILFLFSLQDEAGVAEENRSQKSTRSNARSRRLPSSSANSSQNRKKSSIALTLSSSQRKREIQKENLLLAVKDLLNHFNQKNIDAIVRLIRLSLEKIRKRIAAVPGYGKNERKQNKSFH